MVLTLLAFALLICFCIAVISPNIFFYKWMMSIFGTSSYSKSMTFHPKNSKTFRNIFFSHRFNCNFSSFLILDTKLLCLLYALTISVTMTLLFWINWSLYIHYQYLRGLHKFIHKSENTEDINCV